MYDIAGHQEAVARSRLKNTTRMFESKVPANDKDHLLMRMAVSCADPTLLHSVPHEHHARAVGHDLPPEPRLGGGHRLVLCRYNLDCRHQFSSMKLHTIIHLRDLGKAAPGFDADAAVLQPAPAGNVIVTV